MKDKGEGARIGLGGFSDSDTGLTPMQGEQEGREIR